MVDQLNKALKHRNNELRLGSTVALGAIKDPRSLTPLADALKDGDISIRREAAIAIGGIGDARGISPLLEALKDKDGAVRREAAWGLVRIGDKAIDPLLNALQSSPDHRWELVWALGEIRDEKAVPALIEALRDRDQDVRREAAWALWFIGDERARQPLKDALGENSAIYEAEIALGRIEQRDTLAVLRQALLAKLEKERLEKEALAGIRTQIK